MPVTATGDSRPHAVVGASIVVDSLAALQLATDLPAGSVVTVLRADGRVLLRSTDLQGWITRNFAGDKGLSVDLKQPRFERAVKSLDGTDRLVARVPLRVYAS